jgi:hypothetical protein
LHDTIEQNLCRVGIPLDAITRHLRREVQPAAAREMARRWS